MTEGSATRDAERPRCSSPRLPRCGSAIASIAVGLSAYASDGLEGVFAPFIGAYGAVLYTFVGVVVLWRRPGHGIGGRRPDNRARVHGGPVLLSTVRRRVRSWRGQSGPV